jgi:hypothetical protein
VIILPGRIQAKDPIAAKDARLRAV